MSDDEKTGSKETKAPPADTKSAGGGRKWLRRIGIGFAVLFAVLLCSLGGAYAASTSKQSTHYDVPDASFTIPDDAASLAEGERLYTARGCSSPDCHQDDGGGHVLEMGPIGTISATNLTSRTADFDCADWSRAVRHGVGESGTTLVFMPSQDFVGMSDRELGLIAGYVRSLPRVDRTIPPHQIGMLARVIDLAGGFPLFPAPVIDHASVREPDPEPGRTVEYGAYLGRLCMGCHGEHLSGGPIPGAPPEMGVPLNLTPHDTGLAGWTEEQFRTVIRTGVTPSGHQIRPEQMPWTALSRMTDDEIGALFLYLQSLPPLPEGSR